MKFWLKIADMVLLSIGITCLAVGISKLAAVALVHFFGKPL